jgi:hypothetical protein
VKKLKKNILLSLSLLLITFFTIAPSPWVPPDPDRPSTKAIDSEPILKPSRGGSNPKAIDSEPILKPGGGKQIPDMDWQPKDGAVPGGDGKVGYPDSDVNPQGIFPEHAGKPRDSVSLNTEPIPKPKELPVPGGIKPKDGAVPGGDGKVGYPDSDVNPQGVFPEHSGKPHDSVSLNTEPIPKPQELPVSGGIKPKDGNQLPPSEPWKSKGGGDYPEPLIRPTGGKSNIIIQNGRPQKAGIIIQGGKTAKQDKPSLFNHQRNVPQRQQLQQPPQNRQQTQNQQNLRRTPAQSSGSQEYNEKMKLLGGQNQTQQPSNQKNNDFWNY